METAVFHTFGHFNFDMQKIPVRHIAATQKEPGLSGGFGIRGLRDLLAGKDMVQELHRHDFFYVLALKKGSGHHEIDFTPYKVGDKVVYCMRPGQVHQLTLKAGSEGYLMHFQADFYYPHKAAGINFHQPGANQFEKLFSILTYIFQEYTDKQERYQEVIKANLDIFFIELVRQQSKVHPNTINPFTQEQLYKLLQLIEAHITSQKQASEYANMLHLSLWQLNTITKTTVGKTCSALINEYIILEAKRYLLATANQVKEIAWHLGYEDSSYFIRFFKKHTGHSPEEFRHHFK